MNRALDQGQPFSITDALSRDDLAILAAYEPPIDEAEAAISTIWAQALSLDRVGRNDDFFDLGGDSYAATEIAGEIADKFGLAFAPANIVDNSTVARQAALIACLLGSPAKSHTLSCLVGYHKQGKRLPLFMIHGANGFTFFNKFFLEFMGNDQPIYLFHVPGFDGRGAGFQTLEGLAAIYTAAMQSIQPKGPYNIASICNGAFIGLEMCIRLKEQGEAVKNLILIDPNQVPKKIAHRYPPVSNKNLRRWGLMKFHIFRQLTKLEHFLRSRGFALVLTNRKRQTLPKAITRRREKILRTIHKLRQNGQMSEKEILFRTPDMINALDTLKVAFENYAPEKSYTGHAHMLVNNVYGSSTIRSDLFWKHHLGSFDYEMGPGTHHEFFSKHIELVADFVNRHINN